MLAILLSVAILTSSIAGLAMHVDSDGSPARAPDRPADVLDAAEQVRALHDAGVTGENVSVGVVVATGVDPEASFASQVVASRAFAPDETIRNGGHTDHGTATAAAVATVAPDADLYLASFDRAAGFDRALSWLRGEGVDVIVAPVAFYGRPGNGSSAVARAASRATESGVTVVAPVGNLGQGHWEGAFAPTDRGRHEFSGGTRNYLESTGGRTLTMWLSWRASTRDPNFTIELYRQRGNTSSLVTRSRPFAGDAWPNQLLTARLDPRGTYFVRIRGPPNASGTRLELSSPTHVLQYRERGGSVVAPATARAVIAVGAYDPHTGEPRPFSSAGPIQGRPGVDVIAPDGQRVAGASDGFVGTSGASAYAAGVVALMLAANPDLAPKQVEAILEVTAVDAGPDGVDPVTGYGRLVPKRAVARAGNVTA